MTVTDGNSSPAHDSRFRISEDHFADFVKMSCIVFLSGRFKKEIVVDGQSYLMLIRDEEGTPEIQVNAILQMI